MIFPERRVAVKLLMTWNILPEHEQEYFEFVVRDFIPGAQKMGLELSEAWYTAYGSQPQILAAGQMPSILALKHVLDSFEWKELTDRLLELVVNYQYKIVQARGGFQM
jgi:hypothetical protein